MQTKVSGRGQTVIPREIRRAFSITAQTRLEWVIRDGMIIVHPLPADPVDGSFGLFRDDDRISTKILLAERRAERKRERDLESR